MNRTIEYEGIACTVFTTAETTVARCGADLLPETAVYAALRWLGRCRPLARPLTALCLAFRRGLVRQRTLSMEVSLPARAAGLASNEWLRLLLVLSCEGVWLKQVSFSPLAPLPARSGSLRRVVFH